MALNKGNAPKVTSAGDFRFKPDASGRNLVWLATGYDSIDWGYWVGFFKKPGFPVDMSWVGASANCEEMQIGTELGGKPVQKGFPLVVVRDSEGNLSVKLWEISKSNLEILRQWAVDDGINLAGKAIVIQKQTYWTIAIAPPGGKHKDLTPAEVAGLELPSADFIASFLGPESPDAVRAKLMERMGVTTWDAVREGFGLAPLNGGGASYDEVN